MRTKCVFLLRRKFDDALSTFFVGTGVPTNRMNPFSYTLITLSRRGGVPPPVYFKIMTSLKPLTLGEVARLCRDGEGCCLKKIPFVRPLFTRPDRKKSPENYSKIAPSHSLFPNRRKSQFSAKSHKEKLFYCKTKRKLRVTKRKLRVIRTLRLVFFLDSRG